MNTVKRIVKFCDIVPGTIGKDLDLFFEKHNWVLQSWETDQAQGYQVYFGEGVQVDNHYEHGFPYLYDRDELVAFADDFYVRHFHQDEKQVRYFSLSLHEGKSGFCIYIPGLREPSLEEAKEFLVRYGYIGQDDTVFNVCEVPEYEVLDTLECDKSDTYDWPVFGADEVVHGESLDEKIQIATNDFAESLSKDHTKAKEFEIEI